MGFSGVISTTSPKSSAYDVSARGFFIAQSDAGVTLTDTQKNATNQLVLDLKAAGLWSKFKAVYPFVGGTATSHKFNLITPADTDAAFRLSFVGGGTHSSNGYLPNGTNAYANTFLTPSTHLSLNSAHLSFYSRTNSTGNFADMGVANNSSSFSAIQILSKWSDNKFYGQVNDYDFTDNTVADSLGFFCGSRTASNVQKTFKNGSIVTSKTVASTLLVGYSIPIGARYIQNLAGSPGYTSYSNRQCAFASIGDGLTDLEAQLFYQITEKYQVALGRNINPTQSFYYNSAYNNETNAFLFSTQITDATIQTATNTLVSDLKTANIWTKMKAVYPMVGGTATTHKFNLVNAQDTDAAFRLNFVGGWTHSANGALPNGTNAYANTFLTPSTAYSVATSGHMSYYSRTDSNGANEREIGSLTSAYSDLSLRYSNTAHMRWGETSIPTSVTSLNSLGFYIGSRTTNTISKIFKNGIQILISGNVAGGLPSVPFYIGCLNINNSASFYSAKQCAFSSIGDGLTDAEALALYNATQTFNTTLGRQV